MQDYHVWQSATLVESYLTGVRGQIPLAAEQLDVLLRLIAGSHSQVANFLDLGCGDGILTATLLARYPQARGLLFDISEPMLAAARQRLAPYAAQLAIVNADYSTPEWLHHTHVCARFDVIVSGFSIHHQPDARKRALYAELYQLLKVGGIFINLEHVQSATPWGEQLFDDCLIDAFHTASQGAKTRDEIAQQHHSRPDKAANILATVENQCDWLRQIGYQDVDCYFKFFELALFAGRKA